MGYWTGKILMCHDKKFCFRISCLYQRMSCGNNPSGTSCVIAYQVGYTSSQSLSQYTKIFHFGICCPFSFVKRVCCGALLIVEWNVLFGDGNCRLNLIDCWTSKYLNKIQFERHLTISTLLIPWFVDDRNPASPAAEKKQKQHLKMSQKKGCPEGKGKTY